jgi:hypothetical protein
MANRRFPTLSMGDWELLGIAAHSRMLLASPVPLSPKKPVATDEVGAVTRPRDGSPFSLVLYWLHVVA